MIPNGATNLIVVGYTVRSIDKVEDFIDMPSAPSNYGAEAALKWENGLGVGVRQRAVLESAFSKLTGRIASVFAADPQREMAFSGPDSDYPIAAVGFIDWLLAAYPKAFNSDATPAEQVTIIGLDAKHFVRVSGIEAIEAGRPVPLRYWYADDNCFDPYHMLVESDRRKVLGLTSAINLAGFDTPLGWSQHDNAQQDAAIAAELITKFGLFPSAMDRSLVAMTATPAAIAPAVEPPANEAPAAKPARRKVQAAS